MIEFSTKIAKNYHAYLAVLGMNYYHPYKHHNTGILAPKCSKEGNFYHYSYNSHANKYQKQKNQIQMPNSNEYLNE